MPQRCESFAAWTLKTRFLLALPRLRGGFLGELTRQMGATFLGTPKKVVGEL